MTVGAGLIAGGSRRGSVDVRVLVNVAIIGLVLRRGAGARRPLYAAAGLAAISVGNPRIAHALFGRPD